MQICIYLFVCLYVGDWISGDIYSKVKDDATIKAPEEGPLHFSMDCEMGEEWS